MQQNGTKFRTDAPIMPISAIAKALGVHQRTLRIYDNEGILCPKRIGNNRRYYSLDDLERGKLILFLTRNLAINLSGVKIIFKMLEVNRVESTKYLEYVNKLATLANINLEVQKNNIEKNSRKGRKNNKDSN